MPLLMLMLEEMWREREESLFPTIVLLFLSSSNSSNNGTLAKIVQQFDGHSCLGWRYLGGTFELQGANTIVFMTVLNDIAPSALHISMLVATSMAKPSSWSLRHARCKHQQIGVSETVGLMWFPSHSCDCYTDWRLAVIFVTNAPLLLHCRPRCRLSNLCCPHISKKKNPCSSP